MTKMQITKLSESRFHVNDADRIVDEDINDAQFLGVAAGHTAGVLPEEILDQFEGKPPTYLIRVGYYAPSATRMAGSSLPTRRPAIVKLCFGTKDGRWWVERMHWM